MIWQDAVMSSCSLVFLAGAPGAAFRATLTTRCLFALCIATMVVCKASLGCWGAAGVDALACCIWTAGAVRGMTVRPLCRD